MSTRRMWAAAAVLTVAALAGAGCGDDDASGDEPSASQDEGSTSTTESTTESTEDDGSPTRDEYVDSMVEADDDTELTEEEARCLYGAVVDTYGVDTIETAGVSPEDIIAGDDDEDVGLELTEAQAQALYDSMSTCVDVRAMFMEGMTEDMSAEEADCVRASMSDDLLEQVVIASLVDGADVLQNDPELASALGSELMPCMVLDPEGT